MSWETVCKIQDGSVLEILGICWGRVLCLRMALVSPNICSLLCAGISDMGHLLPVVRVPCARGLFSLQLYFAFPLNMDSEADYG